MEQNKGWKEDKMAKYGKKTGKGSKERKVFLPESDMSPGGRQTGMMLS